MKSALSLSPSKKPEKNNYPEFQASYISCSAEEGKYEENLKSKFPKDANKTSRPQSGVAKNQNTLSSSDLPDLNLFGLSHLTNKPSSLSEQEFKRYEDSAIKLLFDLEEPSGGFGGKQKRHIKKSTSDNKFETTLASLNNAISKIDQAKLGQPSEYSSFLTEIGFTTRDNAHSCISFLTKELYEKNKETFSKLPVNFFKYALKCQLELIKSDFKTFFDNFAGSTKADATDHVVQSGNLFESLISKNRHNIESSINSKKRELEEYINKSISFPIKQVLAQVEDLQKNGAISGPLRNPSAIPISPKLGYNIKNPSLKQRIAVESLDKKIKQLDSSSKTAGKDLRGGNVKVRLQTGEGKTFLAEAIEKKYTSGNNNKTVIRFDLTKENFGSELDKLLESKDKLQNHIIIFDEEYYFSQHFADYFQKKINSSDQSERQSKEAPSAEEVLQEMFEIKSNLRNKGATIVSFGATESPKRIAQEIEQLKKKRTGLEEIRDIFTQESSNKENLTKQILSLNEKIGLKQKDQKVLEDIRSNAATAIRSGNNSQQLSYKYKSKTEDRETHHQIAALVKEKILEFTAFKAQTTNLATIKLQYVLPDFAFEFKKSASSALEGNETFGTMCKDILSETKGRDDSKLYSRPPFIIAPCKISDSKMGSVVFYFDSETNEAAAKSGTTTQEIKTKFCSSHEELDEFINQQMLLCESHLSLNTQRRPSSVSLREVNSTTQKPEPVIISFFDKNNSIGGDYSDQSKAITHQFIHLHDRSKVTFDRLSQYLGRARTKAPNIRTNLIFGNSTESQVSLLSTATIVEQEKTSLLTQIQTETEKQFTSAKEGYGASKAKRAKQELEAEKNKLRDYLFPITDSQEKFTDDERIKEVICLITHLQKIDRNQSENAQDAEKFIGEKISLLKESLVLLDARSSTDKTLAEIKDKLKCFLKYDEIEELKNLKTSTEEILQGRSDDDKKGKAVSKFKGKAKEIQKELEANQQKSEEISGFIFELETKLHDSSKAAFEEAERNRKDLEKKTVKELREEIRKLNDELEKVRSNLDGRMLESNVQDNIELVERFKELQKKIDYLSETKSVLEAKETNLIGQIDVLQEQERRYLDALRTKQEQNDSLNQNLALSEAQKTEQAAKLTKLEKEKTEQAAKLDELEKQKTEKEKEVSDLIRQIKNQQETENAQQNSLTLLTEQKNKLEERLKENLSSQNDLERRLELFEPYLSSLEKNLIEAQSNAERTKAKITSLEKDLAQKQAEEKEQKGKVASQQQQITELEAFLKEQQENLEQTQKNEGEQLTILRQQLEIQKAQLSKKQEESEAYKAELDKAKSEKRELEQTQKEQFAKAHEEKTELEQKLQNIRSQLEQKRQEAGIINTALTQFGQKFSDTEETTRKIEKLLLDLQTSLAQNISELQKAKKALDSKEEEIAKLKEELAQKPKSAPSKESKTQTVTQPGSSPYQPTAISIEHKDLIDYLGEYYPYGNCTRISGKTAAKEIEMGDNHKEANQSKRKKIGNQIDETKDYIKQVYRRFEITEKDVESAQKFDIAVIQETKKEKSSNDQQNANEIPPKAIAKLFNEAVLFAAKNSGLITPSEKISQEDAKKLTTIMLIAVKNNGIGGGLNANQSESKNIFEKDFAKTSGIKTEEKLWQQAKEFSFYFQQKMGEEQIVTGRDNCEQKFLLVGARLPRLATAENLMYFLENSTQKAKNESRDESIKTLTEIAKTLESNQHSKKTFSFAENTTWQQLAQNKDWKLHDGGKNQVMLESNQQKTERLRHQFNNFKTSAQNR